MISSVVVLVSGGVDSTTVLWDVVREYRTVEAVSVDYGAKHNAKEIPCAHLQCEQLGVPHRVFSMGFISEFFRSDLLCSGGEIPDSHYEAEEMKRVIVPFRNGIMLAVVAGYAESIGAGAVVIGTYDIPGIPDCRQEFTTAMSDAIRRGTTSGVEVLRPYASLTKRNIVMRGRELGIDYGRTWSCFKGGQLHCGSCGSCVERREAFLLSETPDPTSYAQTPALPPKPAPIRST